MSPIRILELILMWTAPLEQWTKLYETFHSLSDSACAPNLTWILERQFGWPWNF